MLDDSSLADKVEIARSWFNKVRTGRMVFTHSSIATFEQLLEAIAFGANTLEAELNILKAQQSVQAYEAALSGPPHAAAIAAAPNVVRLHPTRAKGSGR